MIAFTSFREGGGAHLYTVDVASRQVRSLIGLGDFATGASYSPDGSRLLFSASQNDNTDVYLAQADGSGARRITEARGIDISASWSPDAKACRLRLGTGRDAADLHDGRGRFGRAPAHVPGQLQPGAGLEPEGDLIAFSGRDEHRVFDLYTVAVDSGKVTRLTQNQGTNEKPAWAPNGRYLLFSSTRSGKRQVWMSQPDGSNQRQVTSEKVGAADPAWGRCRGSRRPGRRRLRSFRSRSTGRMPVRRAVGRSDVHAEIDRHAADGSEPAQAASDRVPQDQQTPPVLVAPEEVDRGPPEVAASQNIASSNDWVKGNRSSVVKATN